MSPPLALARAGRSTLTDPPPGSSELVNAALGLRAAGEYELAKTALLAAIRADPFQPIAHMALGEILLAQGEYGPGFREHAWHAETPEARASLPVLDSPVWNGMHLPDTAVLVICATEGYGDTIMFSRYLPWARARCSRLVLGCSPELAKLYDGLVWIDAVVTEWRHIPPHAAHCQISALPLLAGTTTDSIRPPVTPLHDQVCKRAWGSVFDDRTAIGLVWRGREGPNDQAERAIPFTALTRLATVDPRHVWLGLQKHMRPDERWGASLFARSSLPNAGDMDRLLPDWWTTAGIVSALDLLITVDTGMAHLAASLGVETWIMLKAQADWRWGIGVEDTPWYPSVRLFRQTEPGDWDGVIRRVTAALTEREKP